MVERLDRRPHLGGLSLGFVARRGARNVSWQRRRRSSSEGRPQHPLFSLSCLVGADCTGRDLGSEARKKKHGRLARIARRAAMGLRWGFKLALHGSNPNVADPAAAPSGPPPPPPDK